MHNRQKTIAQCHQNNNNINLCSKATKQNNKIDNHLAASHHPTINMYNPNRKPTNKTTTNLHCGTGRKTATSTNQPALKIPGCKAGNNKNNNENGG